VLDVEVMDSEVRVAVEAEKEELLENMTGVVEELIADVLSAGMTFECLVRVVVN
jgi:cell division protein ZapA (FtsZ GTPase activity inhibitor)